MSILLLVVLTLVNLGAFLVKWFLVGFLLAIGAGLANKWFSLGLRGPHGPTGHPGIQGDTGEAGLCQCGTDRDTVAHLAVSHSRLVTEVERMKRDLGQR